MPPPNILIDLSPLCFLLLPQAASCISCCLLPASHCPSSLPHSYAIARYAWYDDVITLHEAALSDASQPWYSVLTCVLVVLSSVVPAALVAGLWTLWVQCNALPNADAPKLQEIASSSSQINSFGTELEPPTMQIKGDTVPEQQSDVPPSLQPTTSSATLRFVSEAISATDTPVYESHSWFEHEKIPIG